MITAMYMDAFNKSKFLNMDRLLTPILS